MNKKINIVPVPELKKITSGTGTKYTIKAFTLVELIVVITILAILATIGFVSFSGYLAGARDVNRISQLKAMSDALELYRTKKSLPIPDDKVDINSGSDLIAYQGFFGKNVLETIEYTESGLDPKNKIYFSYYLTKNKKYFQLMAFLEEESDDVVALNTGHPQGVHPTKNVGVPFMSTLYAGDYTDRHPYTKGKKLGILTDNENTPLQEFQSGSIDISDVGNLELKSYLKYGEYVTGTGTTFSGLKTVSKAGGKYYFAINNSYIRKSRDGSLKCPTGFIPVPGNESWDTYDFCVAKYEMSYSDADTANSTVGLMLIILLNAGVFTLNLSWNSTSSFKYTGFRCVTF